MSVGERYLKLTELARENSSDRRRELLHEITDMFFENSQEMSSSENDIFGELISKVAFELNNDVRRELAIKFQTGEAPRNLAIALANDEIGVAEPIIRSSRSLNDSDLVDIISSKGHVYHMAVTKRQIISEIVSDALVDNGNDLVVKSLLENRGARISEDTFDKVVDRSKINPNLQKPILNRPKIPYGTLNQLFSIVSGPLRLEIIDKFKEYSEVEINSALERAKTRLRVNFQALPSDYEAKYEEAINLKNQGKIDINQLPNIWRSGDLTKFYVIMSVLSGVDYHSIYNPFNNGDVDSIAILCRALGFERPLFVTLAVFALGKDGMGKAAELGTMYNNVPQDVAARAIRFMQVRAKAA